MKKLLLITAMALVPFTAIAEPETLEEALAVIAELEARNAELEEGINASHIWASEQVNEAQHWVDYYRNASRLDHALYVGATDRERETNAQLEETEARLAETQAEVNTWKSNAVEASNRANVNAENVAAWYNEAQRLQAIVDAYEYQLEQQLVDERGQ